MRKIAATYVFPISSSPLKNGIIILNNHHQIVEIIDTRGQLKEEAGLEYYNGILIPGFVNAHCHMELSHLRNKIPEGTGLAGFIGAVHKYRNAAKEQKLQMAQYADRAMYHNGIVAAGDVSNGVDTLPVKKNSRIVYHTFVETFGFMAERAERAFAIAQQVYDQFSGQGLKASVVPHSPYSVSDRLFEMIKIHSEKLNGIVSIHNQESSDENLFFKEGRGGIAFHLKNNIGLDLSAWKPSGENSLPSVLDKLAVTDRLILVHNTYTTQNDIQLLKAKRNPDQVFFVCCPNANLYISGNLPDLNLWRRQDLNICIGTDSLASNSDLSVLAELKTLQKYMEGIELQEMIRWSTLNGAKALRMDRWFGSFEPGKIPGINLLEKVDLRSLKLTTQTKLKRLV